MKIERIKHIDTARLLKQNGFSLPTTSCFNSNGLVQNDIDSYNWNNTQRSGIVLNSYSRPLLATVTKWLREEFHYHIEVVYVSNMNKWSVNYQKLEEDVKVKHASLDFAFDKYIFDTYEEAEECAIEAVLKELVM